MSSRHGEINSKARSTTLLGSTDARSGFSSAIRTGTWAITSPSWPANFSQRIRIPSALFYADPDITFIAPWKFFEEWVSCGVALCADSNFPRVSLNHPWRCKWAELIAAAGLEVTNRLEDYPNSGFFGIRRQDGAFLDRWIDLTEAFERQGGNTRAFLLSERTESTTGDQDLMAATMMTYSGPVSFLGQEAMGFNGHYFILSHAIESPKPWNKKFLLQALKGSRPSVASGFFVRNADSPIRTSPSRWEHVRRRIDHACAKLVGRITGRV
jgi:hypothetical protein